MDKKFYLNKVGLTTLITKISALLKSHTSNTLDNNHPNNFVTVKAVKDALDNRANLTIYKDKTEVSGNSYNVIQETKTYNGTASVEINFETANADEINALFN